MKDQTQRIYMHDSGLMRGNEFFWKPMTEWHTDVYTENKKRSKYKIIVMNGLVHGINHTEQQAHMFKVIQMDFTKPWD